MPASKKNNGNGEVDGFDIGGDANRSLNQKID